MAFKNIIVEIEDNLGIIKINRPDVLNAVNVETILEIEEAMHAFGDNDNIAVIIITGQGKSFISGSDIARLSEMDSLKARVYSRTGQRVLSYIENMEKPVIAAVNGYALGSGCELAMACDIRIASDKAKFGQPEVKLGLIPGHAGTQRLTRLVGMGKAKELIFTGEIIDAAEAMSIGLVNKVFPPDALMEGVKKLAGEIAKVGPIAVKIAKTVINRGIEADLKTANSYEMEAFSILFSTEQAKEGMKAFLEKRPPEWKK
jgi:enoyl-CoA hydratase